MERYMVERSKMLSDEGGIFDRGTKDISADWGQYLKELWGMVQIMKVPGKKAKCNYSIILLFNLIIIAYE